MAFYTDTIPQTKVTIKKVTIRDLLQILPEEIPFKKHFWISGKLARDGVTGETIIFLIEDDNEPSVELKLYFNNLVFPVGLEASVSNSWRNDTILAMRLYDSGKLILDKNTAAYKSFPGPIKSKPEITSDYVLNKLPKEIPFDQDVYLTGGIAKNGWSYNDVDFIIQDKSLKYAIKKFFTDTLGIRSDVGTEVMKDREPVFLYKIYEKGKLCL